MIGGYPGGKVVQRFTVPYTAICVVFPVGMKPSKWPSPGSDGNGAPNGDHLLARDCLTAAGSSAKLTKENFNCNSASGIL